jgi:hypothetical protein
MADITENDKEESEFDEILNREEALNPETTEKNPAPDVESTGDENELVRVRRIEFNGHGAELFGILIKNFLLNVLTLGIYYPWAKARQLRYFYGASRISNSDFKFHGTGREMLIGLGKTVVVLVLLDLAYEGILSFIFNERLLALTGLLYVIFFSADYDCFSRRETLPYEPYFLERSPLPFAWNIQGHCNPRF